MLNALQLALVVAAIAIYRKLVKRIDRIEGELLNLRELISLKPSAPRTDAAPSPTERLADPAPAGEILVNWIEVLPDIDTSSASEDRPPVLALETTRPELPIAIEGESSVPFSPRLPPPSEPSFDWERWVGARGAAVIGGIVLALAGVFFFRYSIEHGWFPPWLRVVLGYFAGSTCLVVAEMRLRRRYRLTPDAVVGAGIVILYATTWASRGLYGLIGAETAFVLMILVTVTCCAISWRHQSLVTASIGMIGGFLTPLLISTGSDRPIALFGYLLMLDAGMFYLARKRQWPVFASISLLATLFYECAWVLTRMGPERWPLGMAIVMLFALVFGASGIGLAGQQRLAWAPAQLGGIAFPFLFAAYFAANLDLGVGLLPLALMLTVLSAGAAWMGRSGIVPHLRLAAAAAVIGVVAMWLVPRTITEVVAWQMIVPFALLALVFHLFIELEPDNAGPDGPAPAGLLSAGGLFVITTIAALIAEQVAPWPWLVSWSILAAIVLRNAALPGRDFLHQATAGAIGVALASLHLRHFGDPTFPDASTCLAVLIAACMPFQILSLVPSRGPNTIARLQAAALLPIVLLISLVPQSLPQSITGSFLLAAEALLGVLAAFAAARLGRGEWLLAAVAVTACAHTAWGAGSASLTSNQAITGLALQSACVVFFSAWPFACGDRFRRDALAWHAATLSGPLWFLSLRHLFIKAFGEDYIGVLPLLLAATALLAALETRKVWADDVELRQRRFVWFITVAFGFLAVAIPMQLAREWITLGWALQGLVMALLWQRFDQPGLKYFGIALLASAAVRLLDYQHVLAYHPRPSWRLVNWLLYTYWVPAAALAWTAVALAPRETVRLREWERSLYPDSRPFAAAGAGLAAVAVIFVWINLAIADWFAVGDTLRVEFNRMPARDLATSISWALYSLTLLAIGTRFGVRPLRWLSLGLMMGTTVKVFLYDLGELRDLYRVASLLGLALSLIMISLAYQRFVLGDERSEER